MAYIKAVVAAAQNSINTLGYTPALKADGVEGPLTDKAVVWARNNGASVDGEANTLAKLTDGFLLALGVTPTGGSMGAAATTVTKAPTPTGGGQWTPAPAPPPAPLAANVVFGPAPGSGGPAPRPTGGGGSPLNVKPPIPVAPPPPAAKKPSPLPAFLGGGGGGAIGWFAAGPVGALLGTVAGAVGGLLAGKAGVFGAEYMDLDDVTMGAESGTTKYFTASLTDLSQRPSKFYRYAPKFIVDAVSMWAAQERQVHSPKMSVREYKLGVWCAKRHGNRATLYGPPFGQGMARG